MIRRLVILCMVSLVAAGIGWCQEEAAPDMAVFPQEPAMPTNIQAFDSPNDNGHSVSFTWEKSVDDGAGLNNVIGYEIWQADSLGNLVSDEPVAIIPAGATAARHRGVKESGSNGYLPMGTDLYYYLYVITGEGKYRSDLIGPVQAKGQWFNPGKWPVFIAVFLFTAFTLFFIQRARHGAKLYVRPLAGIDAVDEAIGRATEMGKPILYVMGLGTAADIATIASFTILSRVAKKVAEYQTSIIVPCYDPIVMTIAQETVKTAYYDAGRPDAYDEDSVYFLTNQQFAYVGGVNGIMMRQKPATNFYLGKFYAESLIMAETGSLTGAIQISGTDEVTQIPFFVVATDYTLIGEELYAASAYLGREPVLLGTLKAQDYGKALVIISIVIGVIATIAGWDSIVQAFRVGN